MSLWLLILLFALIKLPLLALMLWIPFREDARAQTPEMPDSQEDEGGSKIPPGDPRGPRPDMPLRRSNSPRRGPHGSYTSPARTRRPSFAPRGGRVRRAQRLRFR